MVCMNFGKNSNWSHHNSLSAKLPYLQNGTSYSLGEVLILTGTCDFYLVFHISYRLKLNDLPEFWKFLFFVGDMAGFYFGCSLLPIYTGPVLSSILWRSVEEKRLILTFETSTFIF